MSQNILVAASVVLALGLGGCGGGGGGSESSSAPVVQMSVSGLSKDKVYAGDVLIVTGTNLNSVTSVRFNGVAATFTIQSAQQLTLTVPDNATSGNIEINGSSSITISTRVTVLGNPVVTSVSSPIVRGGKILGIDGSNLSGVKAILIGLVSIPVSSASDTHVDVKMPDTALNGVLQLLYGERLQIPTAQTIQIAPYPRLASTQSEALAVNGVVTLTGSYLNQVQQITLGSSTLSIRTRSDASLEAGLPAGFKKGTYNVVLTDDKNEATQAGSLKLYLPITVSTPLQASGSDGTYLSVTGTEMNDVTGVTIGGTVATITSQDSTTLRFAVPAKGNGKILLTGPLGQSVEAGTFQNTGQTPVVSINKVEVAQNHLQAIGAGGQRLVPGKQALIRIHVLSSQMVKDAPVTVTASNAGKPLGNVTVTGPAQLPASTGNSDYSTTFNGMIPPNWIASGLTLTIQVDPSHTVSTGDQKVISPVIGSATQMHVVQVPLSLVDAVGTEVLPMKRPDEAQVQDAMVRRFPLNPVNAKVSTRDTYKMSNVSLISQFEDGENWSQALSEVNSLRRTEDPTGKKNYYGWVPRPSNIKPAWGGLGYVPSPGHYASTAIGLEANADLAGAVNTYIHELGHNLSLEHAPCGSAGNPDPNFPYAGGTLGPIPVTNTETGAIATDIGDNTDVMGYCKGRYFSDYHINLIQKSLEAGASGDTARTMNAMESADIALLEVSGEIAESGIRLFPSIAFIGRPDILVSGSYQLTLETADGRTLVYPLRTMSIADDPHNRASFSIRIPHPGDIARIAVSQSSASRIQSKNALAPGRMLSLTAIRQAAAPSIQWNKSGNRLHITWDHGNWPYASVVSLGTEGRKVMTLRASGGKLDVPYTAGGRLEIGLSDGLNTRIVQIQP
ncbi:hypothetical protein KSF73_15400 [Burkholderiaceae bacterium DAT-1]|nr:hypothetical protein [Burkholderiaceae bacterium DAT-1]